MRRGLAVLAGPVVVSAVLLAFGSGTANAKLMYHLYPHIFTQPPTTAQCESDFDIACYQPFQFERAYGLDPLFAHGINGRGTTIVIVDPYGSPTIQADLASFDQQTGLPNPPSFNIIEPDGPVPAYDPTLYPDQPGSAVETSLDVEYSHAIAPEANILLVESPADETEGVQGFPQIVQAENYVINHHLGDVISQSFGATEQTFPSPQSLLSLRGAFVNAYQHHVTVLAASGDSGSTDYELNETDLYPFPSIIWPASDPLVTAVGGTQLHLDANGNRTAPDNVWNDPFSVCGGPCAGGGGLSTVFSRPWYQDGVAGIVGNARGIPDASMSAAVDGSADVYFSFDYPGFGSGWLPVGGTSEATPEMAGEVALADQLAGHPIGLINPRLYAIGDGPFSGLTDITSGNNTVTFTNTNGKTYTVPGYNATRGYDLASGLGTPNGLLPFELAGYRLQLDRHH